MAKHGLWTVIIEDKTIVKKCEDFSPKNPMGHTIEGHDSFWNDSKWSNIHAIQFTDDGVDNDQVEYEDDTPNGAYDANALGDFRSQFITKFDEAHLLHLQQVWDEDQVRSVEYLDYTKEDGTVISRPNEVDEPMEDQIARKGPRPTSYSSS
tara:strand:- start:431 stop:883 length:453 start_codon:yes stop_codon:yes gene_type:complete